MIYTIELLETTECGPESIIGNRYQKVFLNQGLLDGACGPYSIFMGLLSLGLIDRKVATSSNIIDGRTRLGKLFNKLNNDYFSLFIDGTYLTDLENILNYSFGSILKIDTFEGNGRSVINFTIEHLKDNHPTIVGVTFSGGAHWMLAVGYEEKNNMVSRLLLLDPSGTEPIFSIWNTIIETKAGQSGKYPYKWWTNNYFVNFQDAIAIWNK